MLSQLLERIPRRIANLEAKLTGVNGFTGRGEIEFSAWASGARSMEVELRGVAGRSAEVYVSGSRAASVELAKGRADVTFRTRYGDDVPSLVEGARVEIRQNGDVILEGILAAD